MLNAQPMSEMPFGIAVRALNEVELNAVLGRLGQGIGPILNQHTRVDVQKLALRVDDNRQAVSALFDALMSIAPQVISSGCDEPESERVRRLPILLAIVLFCRIVELTLEKWGLEPLFWKLSHAAGQNSTLSEFLFPMLRNRVAAMEHAALPSPHPNRKERRRASSRRSRR